MPRCSSRLFSRKLTPLKVIVLFALSAAGNCLAQNPCIWAGGNGNWFPSGSASPNWFAIVAGFPVACIPSGSLTADIGNASGAGALTGTVNLNKPVTIAGVSLGNGATGGLTVSSAANALTAGSLFIGNSSTGSLTIQGRGVATATDVNIGASAGANGSATVTGTRSQLSASGLQAFLIGDYGHGTLAIEDGGAVDNNGLDAIIGFQSGSQGEVTVSGSGSQLSGGTVYVGYSGKGTLNIQNGAMMTGGVSIGFESGSASSIVTVSGSGSQWNSEGIDVGHFGKGMLTIEAGGVVNVSGQTNIALQQGASGIVTVSGSGSRLNNSQPLNVGNLGAGMLTIESGGVVNSSYYTLIGVGTSGTGTVMVSGPGSQLNNTESLLGVGDYGQGLLSIQNGGVVTSGAASVGNGVGSFGAVAINGLGSRWANNGSLDIGVAGTGSVTVENSGSLSTGSLAIGSHGALNIDPSSVDVLGNFSLAPSGVLSLDIAGTEPSLISQLNISGFGFFDGTVDLDFIDGFAPRTGDDFKLITSFGGANFSGASFDIEGLEPGFRYTDTFSNGQFVVTALNNGVSTTATPEPTTFRLWSVALILGVCSLLRSHRRSSRS